MVVVRDACKVGDTVADAADSNGCKDCVSLGCLGRILFVLGNSIQLRGWS